MARKSIVLAGLAVLIVATGRAHAMTLADGAGNIVELLGQSSDIVVGRVDSVTDGFDDHGIPYTEVTLEISESIRGDLSGIYRFRQFGLVSPRLTPDGKRKMMPSPPGFPKYTPGEDVALFLRPSAAWTGFRMPAGVTHGKFTVAAGRAENGMGNVGLFRNVHLDKGLVTERDKRLLTTESGPLNPDAFLSFVRRAVHERWIESNRMTRTDRRVGPGIPLPADPGGARDRTPAQEPPARRDPRTDPLPPNASVALPGPGR
jgi:hypothetical protein